MARNPSDEQDQPETVSNLLIREEWEEQIAERRVQFQRLTDMYFRRDGGTLQRITHHINYDESKVQIWASLTPGQTSRIVAEAINGFWKRRTSPPPSLAA